MMFNISKQHNAHSIHLFINGHIIIYFLFKRKEY